MPSTLYTCRIFIASPGDTGEEARCVKKVCAALNKRPLVKEKKILLDPVDWEDAVPRAGDAGEIINLLAAECDILVCLFHRQMDLLGDTAREVFVRAYDRWKKKKKPEILLYFKQVNVTSTDDLEDPQLRKVFEFKKKVTEERLALFKEFSTPEEFSKMLTLHLETCIREFTPGSESQMITTISTEVKQFLIDRFSNESAFDNLCRETGISYFSTGDFETRITGLLNKAERHIPDYIKKIYTACITLRPGFTDEINRLFKGMPKGKTGPVRIFLSYSWKTKDIADELDTAFQSREIQLVRDIYDVKYKYDLNKFMKSIRDCDFAITILSDAYLKSPNCMFEIIELLKEQKFRDKILPVFLDDTKIFSPSDRIEYITYWNKQYNDLKTRAGGLELAQAGQVAEDLKTFEMIRMEIDGFMAAVSRMRLIPYEELKAGGFKEIFDEIEKMMH